MLRLPKGVFELCFFLGVGILITGGVQWQVGRKVRTNFNQSVYIEDSRTGNSTRYRVLVGKDDTAGEYFTLEVLMRANAYGAIRGKPGSQSPHYHLAQEERVRVKAGKLGYFIGHHSHVAAAEAGELVVIRPGEAHLLFNAGGGAANGSDLLVEVTFKPARHGEALYETLAGLGFDAESVLAVSPLQRWLTWSTAEVVPTDIPPATWAAIQRWLVPFARKLGYRPFWPDYSTRHVGSERAARWDEMLDEEAAAAADAGDAEAERRRELGEDSGDQDSINRQEL